MTPEPLAISVRQAMRLTPIGKTKLFELIADGRLKSKMVDGRRLICYQSFRELVLSPNPSPNQSTACGEPERTEAND